MRNRFTSIVLTLALCGSLLSATAAAEEVNHAFTPDQPVPAVSQDSTSTETPAEPEIPAEDPEGTVSYENLEKIVKAVGREHLVLDLSCRKKDGIYYIVTDRWQNYTDVVLNQESLDYFSGFCDEFLIHAVDVEGKAAGIETEVAKLLGNWGKIPMTYAGGIHEFEDLKILKTLGKGKVDFTIGSALDLFGGKMEFERVVRIE